MHSLFTSYKNTTTSFGRRRRPSSDYTKTQWKPKLVAVFLYEINKLCKDRVLTYLYLLHFVHTCMQELMTSVKDLYAVGGDHTVVRPPVLLPCIARVHGSLCVVALFYRQNQIDYFSQPRLGDFGVLHRSFS